MSLKVMRLSEEPGEPMPGEGHVGVNSVMAVEETQVDSYSCRVLRIARGEDPPCTAIRGSTWW